MVRLHSLFLLLFTCFFSCSSMNALPASAQDMRRKGSPFDGLRWEGTQPQVQVGEIWYVPVEIAGVEVSEILTFCSERWPGQVQKRFAEDLVEAMGLMGHSLPEVTVLSLVRLSDRAEVVLDKVEVTRAKREALARRSREAATTLPRDRAMADLEELSQRLVDQFAYLELGEVPWRRELEEIAASLPEQVSMAEFADQLTIFMARFRDGHASISSSALPRVRRFPPFLLQDVEGGVAAFRGDRSGLLDPENPYLHSIDGVPIDDWVARAAERITKGSPQLMRRRGLRALRDLERLRREGDDYQAGSVRVELSAGAGSERVERTYPLTADRPTFGEWPRRGSALLEGNIGYLRLARMDDDRIPDLHRAMAQFRDTRGLVVDVRGNGGGSRGLLVALAGYLTSPEEGPFVGNVAKYIASERFGEEHLEARFMYRQKDNRWSDVERGAIEACSRSFQPEWSPSTKFSEWHYLVLGPTGASEEYFYDRPVVVLSDSWCFSATDIFLGALSGRPRVTLMGEASSGGSARSQRFVLPNSGIRVQCASMVSYRTDGRLYDGRGVEVDVQIELQPTDLYFGGTDTVLDAALASLGA